MADYRMSEETIKEITEKEINLMKKLSHPNIIKIVEDYPSDNGKSRSIVM